MHAQTIICLLFDIAVQNSCPTLIRTIGHALHWLAVSQVNPDIILTKINKYEFLSLNTLAVEVIRQKLAGGGFQAGDRASTPLQCSSCLWPSCSPGSASPGPGLPSTTLASCPLDCHRSLRIFWRRNILHQLTVTFKMLTPS